MIQTSEIFINFMLGKPPHRQAVNRYRLWQDASQTNKYSKQKRRNEQNIFNFATDLKELFAILFSIAILLQPLSKVWIVISFKINQKEIARTLCVKKEIENNTCQGKCHLKRQIDKADEQEKKQAPTTQKEKIETLYCHNIRPLWLPYNNINLQENKLLLSYKNNFYPSGFLTDIFHPPELIWV